jgi:hypothetical protein
METTPEEFCEFSGLWKPGKQWGEHPIAGGGGIIQI